jgi:UDP-N-acetylmuramoylalanine--D-glutamate ligase
VRISQLEDRRVALWGWGRESRAAHSALRSRLPQQRLTVLCNATEADSVRAMNDALVDVVTSVDANVLASFDVVIKSPGISAYAPEIHAAIARGTRFIGGSALWFAENPDARTLCVTGTKGKSTTTALVAHLLRAGGHLTALAGNIGMPLLELLDAQSAPEFWAIELSSYQTRDVAESGVHPEVAVGLNVYPEHLDWHGSEARYVADKLALFTEGKPRIAVLNALDPALAALDLPDSDVRWFNADSGWHLRDSQLFRDDENILDRRDLPLPGRHNLWNLCAALAAIDALGIDARDLAKHALTFQPLPHRLQLLGERAGIRYVNDSISTTPHASLAALDLYANDKVAILVGGYDRGVGWVPFVERMRAKPVHAVITMGQNGPRIHAELQSLADAGSLHLSAASNMRDAIAEARASLPDGGVILLSPGAPSFGAYADYAERGRNFAAQAGFDPDAINRIPGLGIA